MKKMNQTLKIFSVEASEVIGKVEGVFNGVISKEVDDGAGKTHVVTGVEVKEGMKVMGLKEDDILPVLSGVSKLDLEVSTSLACSTCQVSFPDRESQRQHFKLDWHRLNIKLRNVNKPVVSEERFEEICDGVSSISGSDDSEDEVWARLGPGDDSSGTGHTQASPTPLGRNVTYLQLNDGRLLSLYTCLLRGKRTRTEDDQDIIDVVKKKFAWGKNRGEDGVMCQWAVLMLAGGHFAGGVFHDGECVVHKTLHRYIIRAKRGTVQSTCDNQKGVAVKSAGAALRRHNLSAMTQEIQELLLLWQPLLQMCSHVFVRATGYNATMLFPRRSPVLARHDERVRMIPFPTKRPTHQELWRVHGLLSTVNLYEDEETIRELVERFQPPDTRDQLLPPDTSPDDATEEKVTPTDVADSADVTPTDVADSAACVSLPPAIESPRVSSSGSEEGLACVDETRDFSELKEMDVDFRARKKHGQRKVETSCCSVVSGEVREEVVSLCRDETLTELQQLLVHLEEEIVGDGSESSSLVFMLNNDRGLRYGKHRDTLLHVAARRDAEACVKWLLHYGLSPATRNTSGQVAYSVGGSKVRDVLRSYRADNPSQYDYSKTDIPEPLSKQQEEEKKAKRDLQRQQRKAKQREKKAAAAQELVEREEKHRFLSLSDREKRALAAERRMLATGVTSLQTCRCFQCGGDITGKTPFQYDEYRFCTVQCVKQHRQKIRT